MQGLLREGRSNPNPFSPLERTSSSTSPLYTIPTQRGIPDQTGRSRGLPPHEGPEPGYALCSCFCHASSYASTVSGATSARWPQLKPISGICRDTTTTWSARDLVGVLKELAEHHINVDPRARPVKQTIRRTSDEKRKVIGDEVAKLLAAGFIMEILYTTRSGSSAGSVRRPGSTGRPTRTSSARRSSTSRCSYCSRCSTAGWPGRGSSGG